MSRLIRLETFQHPDFSAKFCVFVRGACFIKERGKDIRVKLFTQETSLSFSSIASYSLHFKEILLDINGRVHNEIYISVIVHELFAQSNHRSMAKLLILAALLFLSSKTGVSSVGTTTSPQQQNPQTGADKDPCEVLLSILYPKLFTIKLHVLHNAFICHTSVYHSCPPS